MKSKKIWANFSVKDAKRTHEFYTRLGFTPTPSNSDPKLASFLFGEHNFVIHFFEQGTKIDEYLSPGFKTSEIIFTLSAETEKEVNEWKDRVKEAGGRISHETERNGSGYYGFTFADPDGHLFNVLLMEEGI
ncbi:VOC family protein [Chryseobacterium sp. Alg-005]|uniref:VOC family protein n=1 Tax=Chryseobacterium sp. Alg-005 TaxID=3159516 RepID=UPI0035558451